jgi:pimeloyl-ACP methyl ester carboxylesterase
MDDFGRQRLRLYRFTSVAVALLAANLTPGRDAMAQSDTVSLQTAHGILFGTLLQPETPGMHPLAVIIAGSGPTDRDGNSGALPGKNNSLKMLAEALAERGIASLRYDKRGIAESRAAMGLERDLRFDQYADDAAGWVTQYRGDPRFSTITIVGHSEGSLLGMLAARAAHADGYVSIAGAGRSAPQVLREQLAHNLQPDLLAQAEAIMQSLEAGTLVDTVPKPLWALFRPSVQPYLASWFRHDPAREIAELTMPVLVVQGTTDLQVTVADATRLAKAQPRAKLVVLEGMNHVLKPVGGSGAAQLPSYSDPTLRIVSDVPDAIARMVKTLKTARS